MISLEVELLKKQLSIARKEIQNLRKQMKTLTIVHQKDLQNINGILTNFRCQNCKSNEESYKISKNKPNNTSDESENNISLKPIGTIKTEFSEKRAVPRQSNICLKTEGYIEISPNVFNNPEHSIDGLQEFSHMWVIYHFHKNNSHLKSKVAPPRLGGERVGVFSTRSPHRPCPIGLSLVKIEKISGSLIYFNGTDMIDGTPVLDIKPYIPIYDNPRVNDDWMAQQPQNSNGFYNLREEPDGEETIGNLSTTATTSALSAQCSNHNLPIVKVPNWINNENQLKVLFNERAEAQLIDLHINRAGLSDVLKTDPRSLYLRMKYESQIFTFQLSEVTVTCKFDDQNKTVTVVQIRKKENLPN